MQWNVGEQCAVCRQEHIELVRHEIFHGSGRRELSKKYGLWITCCPGCHSMLHHNPQGTANRSLQQQAQHQAMEKYGWSKDDFIHVFGNNYL